MTATTPNMIPAEVTQAEVIFVNHSGGKDSQAMLAYIMRQGFTGRVVLVHSDLGEMEWEPMHGFITANGFGCELHVVKPAQDFFELCRRFARLPSGVARFCTSELKTAPIARFIKAYMKAHGFTRGINAIGIRAEESPSRAKKNPFALNSKLSTKRDGVQVWEWFPIFNYTVSDVWFEIKKAGQQPHAIYSQGFSRLSCVFCVFGRVEEHRKAKELRPELFAKVAKLERELGKTIRLRQVNGQKLPKYLDETFC